MRAAAVLGSFAVTGWVLLRYPTLPAQIPVHFTASGEADSWGSRSSALVLAGVMLVMLLGLALLSTRPRWFNYPFELTAASAQAVYREGERLMVWLLVPMVLLYVALAAATIGQGMGSAALTLLVASLLGLPAVTLIGLVRLVRASSADGGPADAAGPSRSPER